jgi:hypothetical protein
LNNRDTIFYFLGTVLGALAGLVDVWVGDLLFTALLVLASCMLLGALRPERPWRWVVVVGVGVPVVNLLAYLILSKKPYRAQIYESFLAFLPGVAGAYGGSFGRGVIRNIFSGE